MDKNRFGKKDKRKSVEKSITEISTLDFLQTKGKSEFFRAKAQIFSYSPQNSSISSLGHSVRFTAPPLVIATISSILQP